MDAYVQPNKRETRMAINIAPYYAFVSYCCNHKLRDEIQKKKKKKIISLERKKVVGQKRLNGNEKDLPFLSDDLTALKFIVFIDGGNVP